MIVVGAKAIFHGKGRKEGFDEEESVERPKSNRRHRGSCVKQTS